MNDKALQDWLKSKSGGPASSKLTEEEQAELARFDRLWEAAAPAASDLVVDSDAAWTKVDERLFGADKVVGINRRGRGRWLQIAAALLVLALAVFAARTYLAKGSGDLETLEYATTTEANKFTLPDGTQIFLNKHSQLAFSADENNRMVTLVGEAFFDVTRNEEQPFSITTGDVVTTVLGTSFNIRAYANEPSEVVVKSGKVAVAAADQEVVLQPDEKVVYQPKAKELSKKQPAVVDAEAWRTKVLDFTGAPLSEVISTLEKVYDRKIEIKNLSSGKCPYTSSFQGADLPAILADISFVLGVEVTENSDRIIVDGSSCE